MQIRVSIWGAFFFYVFLLLTTLGERRLLHWGATALLIIITILIFMFILILSILIILIIPIIFIILIILVLVIVVINSFLLPSLSSYSFFHRSGQQPHQHQKIGTVCDLQQLQQTT